MIIKITLTIIFLAVMIGVGLYTRKQASSVDGFVLGGRAVGPWLTAFAYGTSYFSAVVFVAMPDSLVGVMASLLPGSVSAMPSSAHSWHGLSWVGARS